MKQDIFDKNGKYLPGINVHDSEHERRLLKQRQRYLEETSNQVSAVNSILNSSNNETSYVETHSSNQHVDNNTHNKDNKESGLGTIFFTNNEILLFASVISATDAVAALAFVKEESDPKLFPILFGEGVVNDAVCIVLYQIIKSFLASGESKKN
jgi:hypothetical protein